MDKMENRRGAERRKHNILARILSIFLICSTVLVTGCSLTDSKLKKVVPNPQPSQTDRGNQDKTPDTQQGTQGKTPDTQQNTQDNNTGTNKDSDKGNSNESPVGISLEGTTHTDSTGKEVISNTNDIMVLVNKQRNLPKDWVPDDLVVPNITFKGGSQVKYMRKEAAQALEKLFDKAKEDNIPIAGVSGYRSYSLQDTIFQRNAKQYGEKVANMTSAYPGQSEHQTGLAMDISCASEGYDLQQSFASTPEGKWLYKNAADFGFIIRYQKGKESITGYSYEPWHIRYVGVEAAKYIMEHNITLEEYLGFKPV